jgi:hypothetical protein
LLDIIAWLQGVERLACDLYGDAAAFFQGDEALSAFLRRMSQEEAWHLHLVGSAGHYLRHNQLAPAPGFTLTPDIQTQVETPLRRATDLLSDKTRPGRICWICCCRPSFPSGTASFCT